MKRIGAVAALLVLGQLSGLSQLRQVSAADANPRRTALVTITPRGLVPQRIVIAEGPFALRVENRSLAQALTVALSLPGGTSSLLSSSVTPRACDVRQVIDLVPGEYRITVAEHTAWSLTLLVKPKQ